MPRHITTKAEFDAWDEEDEPDVTISMTLLISWYDRKLLDGLDYYFLVRYYGADEPDPD